VFELNNIVKRYGAVTVYDGVSMTIERGSRIALVGPNGAGKSTLMRLMAGIEELSGGERIVGDRVAIGCFAQNLSESLDYDCTVLDELSGDAAGMTTTEIRNLLGAMLFSGDDVSKRVRVLSGGERARLALAKVIARRNNCLLLDEPTNNLDIVAKETLLEALKRFPGTVVIVSHDRYILNQLVTEVIEVGHGHAIRYLGNYDDYLRKKASEEAANAPGFNGDSMALRNNSDIESDTPVVAASLNGTVKSGSAARASGENNGRQSDRQRQADREGQRSRSKAAKARATLESEIENKENERAALATEMNDPDFYLSRKDADQLIKRYDRLASEIDALYQELMKFDDGTDAR
jgi:ATP-binding cassette subfamily F protein 3